MSRTQFIVGGVGATLSGIATLLTTIIGGLMSTLFFFGRSSIVGGAISGTVLAVGLILASIGYLGIKRNYGSGTGTAGFAFSITVAVSLFASLPIVIMHAAAFDKARRGFGYAEYNLWDAIYTVSVIVILILFGIMQILWGTAHITTRKRTGNSGLAVTTGIMLIISGAFTMTFFLTFVGMILFFIGELSATATFLMSRIPQQATQT